MEESKVMAAAAFAASAVAAARLCAGRVGARQSGNGSDEIMLSVRANNAKNKHETALLLLYIKPIRSE